MAVNPHRPVLATIEICALLSIAFGTAVILVYAPILHGIRFLMPSARRSGYALAGAFLFPIPWFASSWLFFRENESWGGIIVAALRHPFVLMITAVPLVVGGLIFGALQWEGSSREAAT